MESFAFLMIGFVVGVIFGFLLCITIWDESKIGK